MGCVWVFSKWLWGLVSSWTLTHVQMLLLKNSAVLNGVIGRPLDQAGGSCSPFHPPWKTSNSHLHPKLQTHKWSFLECVHSLMDCYLIYSKRPCNPRSVKLWDLQTLWKQLVRGPRFFPRDFFFLLLNHWEQISMDGHMVPSTLINTGD